MSDARKKPSYVLALEKDSIAVSFWEGDDNRGSAVWSSDGVRTVGHWAEVQGIVVSCSSAESESIISSAWFDVWPLVVEQNEKKLCSAMIERAKFRGTAEQWLVKEQSRKSTAT